MSFLCIRNIHSDLNSGGIFYPQTSFTVNLVGIPLSHEPYLSIPVDKHSANYISYLRGINLCKKSFRLFHSVSWTLSSSRNLSNFVGHMYEGSVFSKCKNKHIYNVEYQVAHLEGKSTLDIYNISSETLLLSHIYRVSHFEDVNTGQVVRWMGRMGYNDNLPRLYPNIPQHLTFSQLFGFKEVTSTTVIRIQIRIH